MRKKFDNILLGILWWLAATLGVSFWFNTTFGFNIFSNTHWKHLAYMQATKNPINPSFYASLMISTAIIVLGGYFILRPKKPRAKKTPRTQQIAPTQQKSVSITATSAADAHASPLSTKIPEENLSRPSRLINPNATNTPMTPVAPIAPVAQAQPHTPQSAYAPAPTFTPTVPQIDTSELDTIFSNAGYLIKPTPRIKGTQIHLLALGANETVWIGTVDTPLSKLSIALDTLTQIFSDTLEDIQINVNAFAINAPDASVSPSDNILLFDSIDSLGKYIREHRNPPITPENAENFDAFSGYISTVIEYIGKL